MEAELSEHGSDTDTSRRPLLARRRPRVLLVEDDDDLRGLLAQTLDKAGYDVTEAESGLGLLAGLECTIWGDRSGAFDVIVADIQMPDLTALEALEASGSPGMDTPVVLMTAYGNADTRAEAHRLGALAVLDKPLDWEEFGSVVRTAVSTH
jgi:DNA-binding NtrC family response regulator